jgi:hypothetical protein
MAPWLLLLGLLLPASLPAQVSREYDVKAAFLYNFITFTDWPAEAFSSPDSPYVIGVVGDDPFGRALDEIVNGERIKGRPLVVRRISQVSEARRCHVLFVSSSEARRMVDIIHRLQAEPVLTVSDLPGFATSGGAINFTTGDRVGLIINPAALRSAKLAVSSKLLRLARLIPEESAK